MPEKLRLAVIQRFLEGKSQEDVAKSLGVSRSTAQYRIERGVEEIRAFLKRRGITAVATALVALLETRTVEAVPATLTMNLGQRALAAYPNAVTGANGVFGLTFLTWKAAAGISLAVALALIAMVASPEISGSTETSKSSESSRAGDVRSAALLGAVEAAHADAATVESDVPGSAPRVPTSASPGSFTVKGRVYVAGSNQGLREFGVYARSKRAVPDPGMKPDAITDDEGNFQITLPSAGEYEIQTQDSKASYNWMRKDDSQQSRTYYLDGQANVDLRSGETMAEIAIEAGQLLAGSVLFPDGSPAAGVHVWARGESEKTKYWAQRETNAAGQFLLLGLEPGHEIQLYAANDEYASPVVGPITIEKNLSRETIIKLSGAATIEGEVVDSTGHPAPFACAWLRPSDVPIIHPRFLTCDENGRFEVRGLLPASYDVILAPLTDKPLKKENSVTEFHWGTIERSFPEAEPAAHLKLHPGEHLGGLRIPFSAMGIAGRILDETGAPIPGVRVSLSGGSNTLTDSAGLYELTGASGGLCTVQATHADYRSARLDDIPNGFGEANFTLEKRGLVEGQVIDAKTGDPIAAYELYKGQNPMYRESMTRWFKQHNDPEGRFSYKPNFVTEIVYARAPGYAVGSALAAEVYAGQAPTRVTIALERGRTVAGIVVRSTGEPVPGTAIFRDWVPSNGDERGDSTLAKTDDEGRFTLADLPSDPVSIIAWHRELGYGTALAHPGKDGAGPLRIELRGSGGVSVKVTQDRAPLAGAELVAIELQALKTGDADSPMQSHGQTDEMGELQFLDLPIATVRISCTFGHRTRFVDVDVTTESMSTFFIDFPPLTGMIEGQVFQADGTVSERGMLTFSPKSMFGQERFHVDCKDGFYRIDGLPAGPVEVMLRIEDGPPIIFPDSVEIEDGVALVRDFNADEGTPIDRPAEGEGIEVIVPVIR